MQQKTRNRYRPRSTQPSQCDEMLFGKPSDRKIDKDLDWKAPWDNTKTITPLLFDSTDRAGHYTPEKVTTVRDQSADKRKPWK